MGRFSQLRVVPPQTRYMGRSSGNAMVLIAGDRAGKRFLGFATELGLVSPQIYEGGNDRRQGEGDADRASWSLYLMNASAKCIGREADRACPEKPSECIGDEKALPCHLIDASQEGREKAQHREKASEEDDPSAVETVEILPQPDAGFCQADVCPEFESKLIAEFSSYQITEVVPDHCANRRSRDNGDNVSIMVCGVQRCDDQYGLAGKGDAKALQADDEGDGPDAVCREKMMKVFGRYQLGNPQPGVMCPICAGFISGSINRKWPNRQGKCVP